MPPPARPTADTLHAPTRRRLRRVPAGRRRVDAAIYAVRRQPLRALAAYFRPMCPNTFRAASCCAPLLPLPPEARLAIPQMRLRRAVCTLAVQAAMPMTPSPRVCPGGLSWCVRRPSRSAPLAPLHGLPCCLGRRPVVIVCGGAQGVGFAVRPSGAQVVPLARLWLPVVRTLPDPGSSRCSLPLGPTRRYAGGLALCLLLRSRVASAAPQPLVPGLSLRSPGKRRLRSCWRLRGHRVARALTSCHPGNRPVRLSCFAHGDACDSCPCAALARLRFSGGVNVRPSAIFPFLAGCPALAFLTPPWVPSSPPPSRAFLPARAAHCFGPPPWLLPARSLAALPRRARACLWAFCSPACLPRPGRSRR